MNDEYKVSSSVVRVGDSFRVDIRVKSNTVYGTREETAYFTTREKAQAYVDGFRAGVAIVGALAEE